MSRIGKNALPSKSWILNQSATVVGAKEHFDVSRKEKAMEPKTFKVLCISNDNTGSANGFGIAVGKEYTAIERSDNFYHLVEDPNYQRIRATWSKKHFARVELDIAFVQQQCIVDSLITALSTEFDGTIFQCEDSENCHRVFCERANGDLRIQIPFFARGFLAALP
jgi:hypothetical protein